MTSIRAIAINTVTRVVVGVFHVQEREVWYTFDKLAPLSDQPALDVDDVDSEDGSPPCTSIEWRNDSNPPSPPSSPGLYTTFNDHDIIDTGMFIDVEIHLW